MPAAEVADGPPKGYVSAEAKRRFAVAAAVLGSAAAILQIGVPFAAMIAFMPKMFFSMRFEEPMAGRGAFWDGRFWYAARAMEPVMGRPPREATVIRSAAPPHAAEPGPGWRVPLRDPYLVPQGDRLWIAARGQPLFYLAGGELYLFGVEPRLAGKTASRPFVDGGALAVVEGGPRDWVLRRLEGERFVEAARFSLRLPDIPHYEARILQVVPMGDGLHLFLETGRALYHRRGLPRTSGEEDVLASWETVTAVEGTWMAADVGGRPVVAATRAVRLDGGGHRQEVVCLGRTDEGWEPFLTRPVAPAVGEVGVYSKGGDEFLVAAGTPFGVRLLDVKGGRVERETRCGGSFPLAFWQGLWPGFVPVFLVAFVPLGLAVGLSWFMKRYRVARHEAEGAAVAASAAYAPLWRRGLAWMIDGLILGAPFLAGGACMLALFSDPDRLLAPEPGTFPAHLLLPQCFMCAGIPWGIVWLFILSVTEGRSGATPGKWIFGIRVRGVDLRPCGLRRALLRNSLKIFVDGLFNFLVGIMVVALSERRQRLGDLAARTVVVMKEDGRRA
jgi:uncharacterized RDD family membrane protein YckC